MTEKGFEVIDLIVFELSNAIQIAKNGTEFYTDDFKKVSAVKKPVEISIKSAEFILDCLQKCKRNVDDDTRRSD